MKKIEFVWAHEVLDDGAFECFEEYTEKTLRELMEIYGDITGAHGEVKNRTKYEAVIAAIADHLELVSRSVLNDVLQRELTDILTRIDELEEITKKHRHKTVVGLYTEKPAW